MLAASRAGGTQMQSQVLRYILGPIAAQWSDQGWRAGLTSTAAFIAKYLPLEGDPAAPTLGARYVGQRPACLWLLPGARACG